MSLRFVGVSSGSIRTVFSGGERATLQGLDLIPVVSLLDSVTAESLMAEFKVNSKGEIVPKRGAKPGKELRIALVGNWKMRCGISTYAEKLWPEVAALVGGVKLFTERNDNPTSDVLIFGDRTLSPDDVIPCWKRGESLLELADAISSYDPDIVWIQHEFGLWPNARRWLSFMDDVGKNRRVVVTMHSVFKHKDKTIAEAAIPEIVVHLDGARRILKEEKGVPGRVIVIPHGCDPCEDSSQLWNFYKCEHTILQFGFGFRYKGWELALRTVAKLKERFPDVFYTGLFSESPFGLADHNAYFDELSSLVRHLGLRENVAFVRGYQSDASIDSYVRTNKVVLFPYVSHPEHEVFGASGAARLAMSKGVPVVTTNVNHFSDVPTRKGETAEELAERITELFSNEREKQSQVDSQISYAKQNSWSAVAQRYVNMFENP